MSKPHAHVLIVEDDVFLCNIYQKRFELDGFKVSVANNGDKALIDSKRKQPDIILLDILLPKLGGLNVLSLLKNNSATRHIPVILITNLGQRDDLENGLRLGAAEYLIKAHFKPSEIVKKVKQVLRNSKLT